MPGARAPLLERPFLCRVAKMRRARRRRDPALLYLVEVGRSKFADEITVQIGIAEIHYGLSQGY